MASIYLEKKHKNLSPVIIIFAIITCIFSDRTQAAPLLEEKNGATHALLQDRIRKEQLIPKPQQTPSEKQAAGHEEIRFPNEEICYRIDNVNLKPDSDKLHLEKLSYFTAQAEGKCLGIAGIRLLAKTLQNEIIRLGYITTRVNLPNQNLSAHTLNFG